MSRPVFCPNPECPYHNVETAENSNWFYHIGYFITQERGKIERFLCKHCRKSCSSQTFSIHYWTHSTEDLENLDKRFSGCSGCRQISRDCKISYRVLRNRSFRLARSYLNLFDQALTSYSLSEDIAFDGFESYLRSQYFPDNFNIAVGSKSQIPYLFNFTLFRRKGRMTDTQKKRRAIIDTVWKPARRSLINSSKQAFREIIALYLNRGLSTPFTLHTDEKTEYAIALKELPEVQHLINLGLFTHQQTSSRLARTKENPLFSVNYLDREIRKNSAAHVRETVRGDREANMAITRMAIILGYHTFRKPYRIKSDKPKTGEPTHADRGGLLLTKEAQEAFTRFYTDRFVWSHQKTKAPWCQRIWQMKEENPPVLDFITGCVKNKGQPGHFYKAAHLCA